MVKPPDLCRPFVRRFSWVKNASSPARTRGAGEVRRTGLRERGQAHRSPAIDAPKRRLGQAEPREESRRGIAMARPFLAEQVITGARVSSGARPYGDICTRGPEIHRPRFVSDRHGVADQGWINVG